MYMPEILDSFIILVSRKWSCIPYDQEHDLLLYSQLRTAKLSYVIGWEHLLWYTSKKPYTILLIIWWAFRHNDKVYRYENIIKLFI